MSGVTRPTKAAGMSSVAALKDREAERACLQKEGFGRHAPSGHDGTATA
jgi:hypothetical protein